MDYGDVDHILVSAFVERWYPETNSFHFPWGEVTITLHDVQMIMGLPIDGVEMTKQMDDGPLRIHICQMFDITMDDMYWYSGDGGLLGKDIVEFVKGMMLRGQREEDIASAYLFLLIGCTILCDRYTDCNLW